MHCHCGTNNRAPRWTFTDPCKPEVRPGAREESASPAWLATPAMNARNTTKVYIWRLDTVCGQTLYRKCHSHNTPDITLLTLSIWTLIILMRRGELSNFCHEGIHVKLEKFKRGRSPSLHLGKEGGFVRNRFVTFISPINIQIPAEILENDEIVPPLNDLKLFMWYKNIICYTWWTLCWLSNAFSLENSIQSLFLRR